MKAVWVSLLFIVGVCAGIQLPRIAILIVWYGSKSAPRNVDFLFSSIAANENLVDLLLFHEDNDQLQQTVQPAQTNIKLVNLGAGGFTSLAADRMGRELDYSETEIRVLERHMRAAYTRHPKHMLELRPAFGFIFQDYLPGYSHWAYMDMDMVLGNLPQWLSHDELYDYHVVTFSTGDPWRVYIRGPLTLFNATHDFVSMIWKRCSYLSESLLQYFQYKGRQCLLDGYRSVPMIRQGWWCSQEVPDESEFSSRVIETPDISVKYVAKIMADPRSNPVVSPQNRPAELYLIDGAIRFCSPSHSSCNLLSSLPTLPFPVDPAFPGYQVEQSPVRIAPPVARGYRICHLGWTRGHGRCTEEKREDAHVALRSSHWYVIPYTNPGEEQAEHYRERMAIHFRSWKRTMRRSTLPAPQGGGQFRATQRGFELLTL